MSHSTLPIVKKCQENSSYNPGCNSFQDPFCFLPSCQFCKPSSANGYLSQAPLGPYPSSIANPFTTPHEKLRKHGPLQLSNFHGIQSTHVNHPTEPLPLPLRGKETVVVSLVFRCASEVRNTNPSAGAFKTNPLVSGTVVLRSRHFLPEPAFNGSPI